MNLLIYDFGILIYSVRVRFMVKDEERSVVLVEVPVTWLNYVFDRARKQVVDISSN